MDTLPVDKQTLLNSRFQYLIREAQHLWGLNQLIYLLKCLFCSKLEKPVQGRYHIEYLNGLWGEKELYRKLSPLLCEQHPRGTNQSRNCNNLIH